MIQQFTEEPTMTPFDRRTMVLGLSAGPLLALAQSKVIASANAQTTLVAPTIKELPGGISYGEIEHWTLEKSNQILKIKAPSFFGVTVPYTPARDAVRVYRIQYPSVCPEKNNKPVKLSGIIALPDTQEKYLPVMSYQHGTVYLKTQVPSYPAQSPETELTIAQFASQGYAVVAADYLGMGLSDEKQAYLVKKSHQQATIDLLNAANFVMNDLGKSKTHLFLAGWSQGGYVTMAMLERLEQFGFSVRAAATACAPTDLWMAMSSPLLYPRPLDAAWSVAIYILSAFAYEHYYNAPGLARSFLNPKYYDASWRAYNQEPFTLSEMPNNLPDLINKAYFDAQFLTASTFGQLLIENQAYRWPIKTATRNYYGEADEAVRPLLGRLPMDYQHALGGDKVEAINVGPYTHRGTYAAAVPLWKSWFDSLLS